MAPLQKCQILDLPLPYVTTSNIFHYTLSLPMLPVK